LTPSLHELTTSRWRIVSLGQQFLSLADMIPTLNLCPTLTGTRHSRRIMVDTISRYSHFDNLQISPEIALQRTGGNTYWREWLASSLSA